MSSMKKILLSAGALLLSTGAVRADLVSYWNFDEAAGSFSAADSVSGLSADAHYRNNATTDVNYVKFGTDGVFGSTSVTLANQGNLLVSQGDAANSVSDTLANLYSGDYTINLWVNFDSFNSSGWTPIFGDWTQQWSYQFYANSSGKLVSYLSAAKDGNTTNDSNIRTSLTSTQSLTTGDWAMLTFTRDYETGHIAQYINGVLAGEQTLETFQNNPFKAYTSVLFGCKGDDYNVPANMSLDEVRIYDNVLTAKQIAALHRVNTSDALYLNDLIGNTFENALKGQGSADGTTANGGNGDGIAAADNFCLANNKVQVDLTGTGITLDLTANTNLHANAAEKWGSIKTNVCGNDNTVLTAPDGYVLGGAIGMHANAFITYDLNELRDALAISDDTTLQFDTAYTMANCSSQNYGNVYSLVLLSDADDGILAAYLQGEEIGVTLSDDDLWILELPETMPDGATRANPVDIALDLGTEADYLTLMALAGPATTSDHAMYLNPLLFAGSSTSVPEPAAWTLMLLGIAGGVFAVRRKKSIPLKNFVSKRSWRCAFSGSFFHFPPLNFPKDPNHEKDPFPSPPGTFRRAFGCVFCEPAPFSLRADSGSGRKKSFPERCRHPFPG